MLWPVEANSQTELVIQCSCDCFNHAFVRLWEPMLSVTLNPLLKRVSRAMWTILVHNESLARLELMEMIKTGAVDNSISAH